MKRPDSVNRFALGQAVTFVDTVQVARDGAGHRTHESAGLPVITDAWQKRREVSEGVIIGSRTIHDYDVYDEDGYRTATPRRGTSKTAWLVAFNMRRKPVMVLDEDVKAKVE